MKSTITIVTVITLCSICAAAPLHAEESVMEDQGLQERSQREVVELHQFFQDWFNGKLKNETSHFARFDDVLASDFEIIGPAGNLTSREVVLNAVRSGHGKHAEKHFRIDIHNVRSRTVGDGMVLVTYEEHQTLDDDSKPWLSSALFRANAEKPNGVEWLHVHETYLPAKD